MAPGAPGSRCIPWLEERAGAAAFLLAFTCYLWLAGPGEGWLDASEFVAVGHGLGIGHAPGEPVYALLARAATLLPVGGIAFRVLLLSTLCQAGVVALLVCGVRKAARALAAPPGLRLGAITLAALAATWNLSSRLQGTRPEVYALNTLLVLATAAALWRHLEVARAGAATGPSAGAGGSGASADATATGELGWLLVAGLGFGLGLGVHPLVTALALPPVGLALWCWDRRSLRPRALLLAASFALLGFAAYAYLPLRAHGQLALDWGDPHSFSAWLDVLSGRSFQKSFSAAAGPGMPERFSNLNLYLMFELHPLAYLAGLAGLGLLATRSRAAAAVLGVALLANLASVGLQRSFELDNPDVGGYLQPSVLMLIALAALAPLLVHARAVASPRTRGRARLLAGATAALALAGFALAGLDAAGEGRGAPLRSYAAREAPLALLDAQPDDTLLLTANNQLTFSLWALQAVEGARPDVTVVFRGFLATPWFRRVLTQRLPALAAAQDAGSALEPARAGALAEQRPLAIDPFGFRDFADAGLDPVLTRGAGFFLVRGSAGGPGVAPYQSFAWRALLGGDHLDRSFALLHHFLRARKAADLGLRDVVAEELPLARALAPDDPDVAALGAP
ncbi:MAG: DUF2723 domain-containing protein [Deltaproteobacteria bacterium]|nr:DUF2723 domain-containing protein [Deltaproteobacteria bacterium]